jgi:hypothetical protein
VQPRPPVEIDERFSKRRLVSANTAAAMASPSAPALAPSQAAPQFPARPLPSDRRNGDKPGRAAIVNPERATAPSQDRTAPPFLARPPAVQDAPSGRPEATVPPPKRALVAPQGSDGAARSATPRAEPPQTIRSEPPRVEPPRIQPPPAAPRIETPRIEVRREPPQAHAQPPRHEVQAAPMPQPVPPAASQRTPQPAPQVVRPAPKVQGEDGRGRGPDQEPRGKAEGPQRATARDR